MEHEMYWDLFRETGDPVAYVLYCGMKAETLD